MEDREVERFRKWLISEEKSRATVDKYMRNIKKCRETIGKEWDKEKLIAYKHCLMETYAPASVNSMLTSVNMFLKFLGKMDWSVKLLKIQQQTFADGEKELTKDEYKRLLTAAGESRIGYILQTISSTGIRISELRFITVEAVQRGKCTVRCKKKMRQILLSATLRKRLKTYVKKAGIKTGSIFISKTGKPLNRSNIWREMKNLSKKAGVPEKKIFPHNLRHLFARIFYKIEKDIVRLANIMGHSSINTTRIYTLESIHHCYPIIDKVGRLLVTT